MNITYYIIIALAAWILYNTVWQTVKEAWRGRRLKQEGDELMNGLAKELGLEVTDIRKNKE